MTDASTTSRPLFNRQQLISLFLPAAKKYPKECRQTRKDIEKRMNRTLAEWKGAK